MIEIELGNAEETLTKDIRSKEERLEAFAEKIRDSYLDAELKGLPSDEQEHIINGIVKDLKTDFTAKDISESVKDGSFYNISDRSQNIIAEEISKHWINDDTNEVVKLKTEFYEKGIGYQDFDRVMSSILDSGDRESLEKISQNKEVREQLEYKNRAYGFIERTIENGKTPFPEATEWAKQFVPDIDNKLAQDGNLVLNYPEVQDYLSGRLDKLSTESIDRLYSLKTEGMSGDFYSTNNETKLTCELIKYGTEKQNDHFIQTAINNKNANQIQAVIMNTDYKIKPEMIEQMKEVNELKDVASLPDKKQLSEKLSTTLQHKPQAPRMKI